MSMLFLVLQITMLVIQLYSFVRGVKSGDMFSKEALYGCGIWGGAFVILLGMVSKSFGGV